MKVSENRRIYGILCASLILSTINIPASGMLRVNENQNKKFEINQPLREWPRKSRSSEQEEICYKFTWDDKKSLEENKYEVVRRFISNCCDFSFKVTDMGLKGIYYGTFDNDESIVFIDSETRMLVNPSLDKILFFNEKDSPKGLEVHPLTNLMENIKPINFEEWMIFEFERYIQRFVEDPVGCEVLRRSIAKYEAEQEDFPKVKFIPVDDQKMSMAYTPGGYVWRYVRRHGRPSFGIYEGYSKENKFIIFSPDWFSTDQKGLMLKLSNRKTNYDSDSFVVNTGVMPRESSLMYQIIYAIHAERDDDHKGTHVIENRDPQNYFRGDFDGVGAFSIQRKQLNTLIFKNDKIYRVMYGLTKRGFDLINESSYLAHRYNFIRPAYMGSKTRMTINGKRLDRKDSCKFLKKFLKTNGDFDLYKYYLSGESSINYPEFGKGHYKCSDIDFKKRKKMSYIRK